ncbi:MAG: methyltransferase domain-containing protein [Betaproteobacteria bacterium]|nr:methyltransferase domain-containing protein [Betaproteobacteria bacterium]
MGRPVLFQSFGKRLLHTFLPWLVWRRRGVTTREYWESYPTKHFLEMEPASLALLAEVMELAPDRNSAILDMGCNVGRHLNHLYGHGYRNLRGVDFNRVAVSDMQTQHPEMFAASKVTASSFQDFLDAGPEPVDIVYTRGATFENVHPSYPLVKRVCAIAKRYVVMVILETGHTYPRFWEYEFARAGFELAHLRRPAAALTPEHRVSLLTFQRLDG